LAGPGPTCAWEQDHRVQDGTSCLAESRLPGPIEKRSPWLWERGEALFEAYVRAEVLAPAAIVRQTGYALGEVLKGLLPGLLEMLIVLAATTTLGAVAGGVIGFFFGGAGAAPGAVIGGELGLDIGLAALTWLGVAFLAKAMFEGFGRLWAQLSLGVRHAWEAPEYPEREYPHRIEEAARELAEAAGILMLLLLQAVVAWVLKRAAMGATQSAAQTLGAARTVGSEAAAESAVAELVTKLRVSRLGSGFADWVEKNWTKLRDDPRLRFRGRKAGSAGTSESDAFEPADSSAEPRTAADLEREQRLRDLGTDPRTGQYRPGESSVADRLQDQVGPLEREKTGDFDWVDEEGTTYDAVGPAPSEHFNATQFNRSIDAHLRKQGLDKVVVDTANLTPDQQASVATHIDQLPSTQQERIILLQ
jgi:CdiA C-terminal tRNase domain